MRPTDYEKAMLDGAHGKAKARSAACEFAADYRGNSLRPVIFR